jgi:Carboxypeptidase regulatory-like domain
VPRSFRTLTTGLFVLLGLFAATASIYGGDRNIRGVVVDESKGVLPGVTIVVTGADGRVLATTVTDGAGRYVVGPLAAGNVTLTFQLEGFAPVSVRVTVGADADALVNQTLAVAPRTESVEVIGRVPLPPPPPPAPPPPVPRPRMVTSAVPEHDRDAVCGPARLGAFPESLGTIRSRRYAANQLYAKGDELIIDGGTLRGLEIGRNVVVRRTYRVEWDPRKEIGEHTAGLVQIVLADERTSVAVVIYACDEMMPGDRLASFSPEPPRSPEPAGVPDFRYAARILFPDIAQLVGAPGRMMVIDRGASSGVRAGQRVTLFRRESRGRAPSVIGDAIVVAVRAGSATIRVGNVTDAVMFGDWAALHR